MQYGALGRSSRQEAKGTNSYNLYATGMAPFATMASLNGE